METGLGMQGRTRAVLSLLGKNGNAEHVVLAYLDDMGNIIVVDNSGMGKIFGSGIPIEQYMQNVANRSISQDAWMRMVEALTTRDLSFQNYAMDFPPITQVVIWPGLESNLWFP